MKNYRAGTVKMIPLSTKLIDVSIKYHVVSLKFQKIMIKVLEMSNHSRITVILTVIFMANFFPCTILFEEQASFEKELSSTY